MLCEKLFVLLLQGNERRYVHGGLIKRRLLATVPAVV